MRGNLEMCNRTTSQVGREPRVVILMGCRDGEAHLREQLDSIRSQSFENWVLVASDDGSKDGTRAILEEFRDQVGPDRAFIREGRKQGFQRNFLQLACDPGRRGDYFAFCDQDDIWEREKLQRAISLLVSSLETGPSLYCSRTTLIDSNGVAIGHSPRFKRPPAFRNALVQSIAGGNTMVFNERARKLIVAAGSDVQVPSHDWWLYLLVSGAGGSVHYDTWPSVQYRQHGSNLIGAQHGWAARVERLAGILQGRHQTWNSMHCKALMENMEILIPRNRKIFELFRESRGSSLFRRLSAANRARTYRQTLFGSVGLIISIILNRF